jgi:hypothetical protein
VLGEEIDEAVEWVEAEREVGEGLEEIGSGFEVGRAGSGLAVTDGEAHGLGKAFEPLVVVAGVVAVGDALLGVDPVHHGVKHGGYELLPRQVQGCRRDPHHRRTQLFEPTGEGFEAVDADLKVAGAEGCLLEQISQAPAAAVELLLSLLDSLGEGSSSEPQIRPRRCW